MYKHIVVKSKRFNKVGGCGVITTQYKIHEAANLFPMMSDDEFAALVEDIQANGQREPITIYQNQIIDGRNRYAACERMGIEPDVREWDGKGSLISMVISLNLKRRHLTPSQKAAVAVDMLPLLEAEARKRQISLAGSRPSKDLPQKIAVGNDGEAREQAAKLMGTNRQYVSDAKHIQQEVPEVFNMMKRGELSLVRAKHISNLSEESREKAVNNLSKQEDGKTQVCVGCGELLPVEKFNLGQGKTKCSSCRAREQKIREAARSEGPTVGGEPENEVTRLRKKVKELEARVKELEEKCGEYQIDNYELRNEIMVTRANENKILG